MKKLLPLLLVSFPAFAAASFSIEGVVNLLVVLIIVGIIIGALYFLIDRSPIPDPYKGWIKYLLLFIIVLAIINFLLSLIGHPFVSMR